MHAVTKHLGCIAIFGLIVLPVLGQTHNLQAGQVYCFGHDAVENTCWSLTEIVEVDGETLRTSDQFAAQMMPGLDFLVSSTSDYALTGDRWCLSSTEIGEIAFFGGEAPTGIEDAIGQMVADQAASGLCVRALECEGHVFWASYVAGGLSPMQSALSTEFAGADPSVEGLSLRFEPMQLGATEERQPAACLDLAAGG